MDADTPRDILRVLYADVEDPRVNRTRRHSLHDILTIAILAVICDANNFVQIAEFGRAKLDWLKTFLDLPNGIPSHDTFGRVLSALNPAQFERCLMRWAEALARASGGSDHIALDGKRLRGSFDTASGLEAVHMINAWCVSNHLVLGQLLTEAKSNEITAVPKLLELLDLKGAIVTADAMHCQKKTAKSIIDGGGDYVLQVKSNQGTLHEQLHIDLVDAKRWNFQDMDHDVFETIEKGHGRIEHRKLWCTSEIDWVPGRANWPGLTSVAMVERRRTIKGKTSVERAFYISSLPGDDAKQMLETVRGHWDIENSLHWCLDVTFGEDAYRGRVKNAAENFARLRRIALSLLKNDKTSNASLSCKRKRCGWDHEYLLHILTQEAI